MINIAFLNNSSEWASISGEASILTDRESVRKHYSSALKAWIGDLGDGKHDGGPDGKGSTWYLSTHVRSELTGQSRSSNWCDSGEDHHRHLCGVTRQRCQPRH